MLGDRTVSPTDISGTGSAPGRYPGYDRFGRVRTQTWLRSNWSRGAKPEVAHLRYAYDAEDNPVNRFDRRAEDRSTRVDRDERYIHDGLHRLYQADRGLYNHSTSALTIGGVRGQQWTKLAGVGGWKDFRINTNLDTGEPDFTDSGDTVDVRTYNAANELLTQTINGGSSQSQDHDKAGNLVARHLQVGGSTSTWTYVYDAWNRMVEARVQPTGGSDQTRARYTYNAIHWRATRIADTDQDASTTPDQANLYYYDATWRLLEERIDTAFESSWSSVPLSTFARTHVVQRFWGPEHIDELIASASVRVSGSTFGTIVLRYAFTDRLFSVIGMIDPSVAPIIERVRYTPYGVARHEAMGDVDGDGDVDFAGDLNPVLSGYSSTYTTGTGYTPDVDFDQDGDVDFVDLNAATFRGALPEGFISDPVAFSSGVAAPGNTVGYSGYLFDPAVGLYCVRHRWYSAPLGQWLGRDPIGYRNGLNVHEYVGSYPVYWSDPYGLEGWWLDWETIKRIPGQIPGVIRDYGHDALDGLGLIPALGEPADAINACWYAAEGDVVNAGLCAASMIPIAGWGSTAARQALKHGDEATEFIKRSRKQIREDEMNKRGWDTWPVDDEGNALEIHHKKRKSDGGDDRPENIDVLTRKDHRGKGTGVHSTNGDFSRDGQKGAERRRGSSRPPTPPR